MKVSKTFIASVVAVVGYIKYQKFIDFIDNLKLGLKIVEVDNKIVTAYIENKSNKHIPYNFHSVDLMINKELHAATNTEESTNLSIVPYSNIPVNFRLLHDLKVHEIEQSDIVIKYNFFGFHFQRLYKPTVLKTTGKQVERKINNSTNCGCQH